MALFRGRLVERAGSSGAGGRRVSLRVDGQEMIVYTEDDGTFAARFALSDGEHLLSVAYAGDDKLDASHFEMANFDINKTPVSLTLTMPSRVSDDIDEVEAEVQIATGEGATSLLLNVFFSSGDEELKQVNTLRTAANGKASIFLRQPDLGGPGRKRLEVRFAGSADLDSAVASASLVVSQTSSVTLATSKSSYDYGETVLANGRLLDGRGDPIVGGLVTLRMSSQTIGRAKSDERGDFLVRIDTDEIGSGTAALQAQYAPVSSDAAAGLSAPVRITIGERKPIPILYTVTAFALASFALLSFVTLRTKPWLRWKRPGSPEEQAAAGTRSADAPPLVTGLAQGRKKLRSTIGRANFTDFFGQVRNVVDSKTIADAVVVVAADREMEIHTDAEGRFAISELVGGEYKIRVSAEGFVSEHFSVQMPHRGEFHDAHVDLLPVREKIFSLYKYAVRSLLPSPSLWGIWTPRQILNHVREAQPTERLAELTDFVEEIFFSQRTPNEDKIDLTRAMIRGLSQEPAGPGPQP